MKLTNFKALKNAKMWIFCAKKSQFRRCSGYGSIVLVPDHPASSKKF